MEEFTRALTTIIKSGNVRKNPSTFRGNLDGAPQDAKDLIDAMTTRSYRVDLGAFDMWAPSSMGEALWDVSETVEQSVDMLGTSVEEAVPGFDATKTVLLTADSGGNSMIAISWGRGALEGVVIEHADPTMENVVQFFTSSEAFIAFFDKCNEWPVLAAGRAGGLATIKATITGA
ncbi:MAG: hypothetical protein IT374_28125 [Polyangiaceae bacterium]|nr:hypothetical protein [Polyangiaceae bacterium]